MVKYLLVRKLLASLVGCIDDPIPYLTSHLTLPPSIPGYVLLGFNCWCLGSAYRIFLPVLCYLTPHSNDTGMIRERYGQKPS